MSKQALNVNVEPGIKELVIREGRAEEIYPPEPIALSGRITAPIEYFESRREVKPEYFDLSKSVVLVDINKGRVVLMADPTSKFGDTVEGQLFGNPVLAEFHLTEQSKGTYFSPSDLSNVFRRYIRFFDNQEEARKMVFQLKNLKVETSGKVEKRTDDRGNKANVFEQSVESNIPVSFTLKMPIFQNEAPVRFQVDIFLEVSGSSVHCLLDSVQLSELIETESVRVLTDAVKGFYDSDVTVVHK